jgi:molecular chaperone DnaK (HSP70)
MWCRASANWCPIAAAWRASNCAAYRRWWPARRGYASAFQVDADGLLSVTAREQTTGHEARIEVKPSYGLSDDEIAAMLKDSFSHASDDAFRRALREAQVEAQRLIEAVASALKEDAELLSAQERSLSTTPSCACRRR